MYHAKNCYVKIDNTEMEYVAFGNGTQPFIIIPGLGDALKTVRGTAVPFSYMYRTYAKYFKVYLFSRKNMIPKDYTIADMADPITYCSMRDLWMDRRSIWKIIVEKAF